jgi:hypothetical protein
VQRLEGPAHVADGGAAAVDDDDFSHFFQHRFLQTSFLKFPAADGTPAPRFFLKCLKVCVLREG